MNDACKIVVLYIFHISSAECAISNLKINVLNRGIIIGSMIEKESHVCCVSAWRGKQAKTLPSHRSCLETISRRTILGLKGIPTPFILLSITSKPAVLNLSLPIEEKINFERKEEWNRQLTYACNNLVKIISATCQECSKHLKLWLIIYIYIYIYMYIPYMLYVGNYNVFVNFRSHWVSEVSE